MKNYAVLNQELKNFTDVEFINWINAIENKKSKSLQLKLIIEFNNRNWNYRNLLLPSQKQLELDCPITVSDNIIFQKKIPLPPMVIRFFQKTVAPMFKYINEHPLLKGKRLVSYDFVIDQIFMKDKIDIITPDYLPNLNENDVIVYITQYGKTFPNKALTLPFVKNNIEVIIDKGTGYRCIEKVEVINNTPLLNR